MTDLKTYDVHRSMMGSDGKEYARGATREMLEIDAAEMVANGALSLEGEKPTVRASAVQNTFGTAEPTGHLASTTAITDDAVKTTRKKALATSAVPAPAEPVVAAPVVPAVPEPATPVVPATPPGA